MLELTEYPDIPAGIGYSAERLRLVIGFVTDTANLPDNAEDKLTKKVTSRIIANNIAASGDKGSVTGGTHIIFIF